MSSGARYDVFISYRWVSPDQEWVREQLFPALQAAGLTVLLDVEDFVPGRDLILEMNRAGRESRKVLCVLSPDYFEGNRMVSLESLAARRSDPAGVESALIPLLARPAELPEWIRGLIPVDWTDTEYREREWRKLLKVLGASVLTADAPSSINRSLVEALSKRKDQVVIYDSSSRDIMFDFQGIEGHIWRGKGAEAKPVTPKGKGRLTFEPGGILTVERTNAEGRFEIRLLEYDYQGTRGKSVPRNSAIRGDRKLWLHCEARVFGATHCLMFVAKNQETETWLANEQRKLESDKWTPIDVYFRVDPNLEFFLRIDDVEVSLAPSRVQIRDIRLSEIT